MWVAPLSTSPLESPSSRSHAERLHSHAVHTADVTPCSALCNSLYLILHIYSEDCGTEQILVFVFVCLLWQRCYRRHSGYYITDVYCLLFDVYVMLGWYMYILQILSAWSYFNINLEKMFFKLYVPPNVWSTALNILCLCLSLWFMIFIMMIVSPSGHGHGELTPSAGSLSMSSVRKQFIQNYFLQNYFLHFFYKFLFWLCWLEKLAMDDQLLHRFL